MRKILFSLWWWSTEAICKALTFLSNCLHWITLRVWKARYAVANWIIDFGKPKDEEEE